MDSLTISLPYTLIPITMFLVSCVELYLVSSWLDCKFPRHQRVRRLQNIDFHSHLSCRSSIVFKKLLTDIQTFLWKLVLLKAHCLFSIESLEMADQSTEFLIEACAFESLLSFQYWKSWASVSNCADTANSGSFLLGWWITWSLQRRGRSEKWFWVLMIASAIW